MNRRTFVGAIAALMAAPKALMAEQEPRSFAKTQRAVTAPLTPTGEKVKRIEAMINRVIEPEFKCRLVLWAEGDLGRAVGRVTTTEGQWMQSAFAVPFIHHTGQPTPIDATFVRQTKFQTMKAVEAIERERKGEPHDWVIDVDGQSIFVGGRQAWPPRA